jgi:hypothetical protein
VHPSDDDVSRAPGHFYLAPACFVALLLHPTSTLCKGKSSGGGDSSSGSGSCTWKTCGWLGWLGLGLFIVVQIKKATEEADAHEETEQAEAEEEQTEEAETDFLTESGHISSVSVQEERWGEVSIVPLSSVRYYPRT